MTTFNNAAAGSYHGTRYVAETAFGTTPSTPTMVSLRHTSNSLNLSKESFQSQELRSDRQISDLRHGVRSVAGDIGFELSYGEFDAFLEAALGGTWTTNVLKAGVSMRSFTVERAFADLAKYGAFTGCVVNALSLDIPASGIVTGTFGMLGKDVSWSGTPLDASVTASQANSPYDGFSGSISEGGSPIAVVTALSLSLDNGIQAANVVGSDSAYTMVPGRSNLTGSVSALFTDTALLEKFLNETETSLSVTLGDGVTKSLTIAIPRLKFSGGDVPASGEGILALSLPFQALYDSSSSTNISITRIPGA